jgi:hypothetical protein
MSNYLEDKHLSWKAKGMLAFLLSLPEEERSKIRVNWVSKQSIGGEGIAKSCIKELINNGYLKKIAQIGEKGRFAGYVTIISAIRDNLRE